MHCPWRTAGFPRVVFKPCWAHHYARLGRRNDDVRLHLTRELSNPRFQELVTFAEALEHPDYRVRNGTVPDPTPVYDAARYGNPDDMRAHFQQLLQAAQAAGAAAESSGSGGSVATPAVVTAAPSAAPAAVAPEPIAVEAVEAREPVGLDATPAAPAIPAADARPGRRGLAAAVVEDDSVLAAQAEYDNRSRRLLAEDVQSTRDVKRLLEDSRLRMPDQRRLLHDFTSESFQDSLRRVQWARNPSWPALLAFMGSPSHLRAARRVLTESAEGPSYRSNDDLGRTATRRQCSAPPAAAGRGRSSRAPSAAAARASSASGAPTPETREARVARARAVEAVAVGLLGPTAPAASGAADSGFGSAPASEAAVAGVSTQTPVPPVKAPPAALLTTVGASADDVVTSCVNAGTRKTWVRDEQQARVVQVQEERWGSPSEHQKTRKFNGLYYLMRLLKEDASPYCDFSLLMGEMALLGVRSESEPAFKIRLANPSEILWSRSQVADATAR